MNDVALTSEQRADKLQGVGCKRRRVEDARFIQGKGNYVDDLKLPGMIYGDFVRSPYAHARVKKIDASAATKLPGVLAVLTAAELKPLGLHYMPTLAGDVQAVLAEEKVLFQNQEVAFVIAEDRYTAADAVDLVEVDYEELPVIVDPFKSMAPDAPVLREDIKDKTDGAHGKRKHYNHIFSWEMGDREATDMAFNKAEVTIKELISYQRVHPSPLETCQCVASFDKVRGELTVWGTFQAPHVIRTVASLISKIPEHKIHVISPDIGGGFGNKVGAYAGYICAIVASIVTGRPVKWVEDRIENLTDHRLRPRLPHDRRDRGDQGRQGHRPPRPCARRPRRLRRLRRPVEMAGRLLQHRHRLLRFPGRPLLGRRRLHQQGAGRRRLSLLVPGDGGRLLHRAGDGHPRPEARHGPGRAPHEEPDQARAVPLHLGARLGIRFRRLPDRAARRRWTRSATRSSAPSRRRSRRPSSAARRAS